MGNKAFASIFIDSKLTRLDFSFHYALGKGGFGKVWLVSFRNDKNLYALKEMQKLRIVSKRSVDLVMNEQRLLSLIRHPFIVNMKFAFQDRCNLYLVMDLLKGGDLRYHMLKNYKFSEEQVRFICICIVAGIEYLHINKIMHLDLKPENLVFDMKGYLRITDFGIASEIKNYRKNRETSGTLGYMAPEVILGNRPGPEADYFALGVIIHELVTGKRPYLAKNKQEMKEIILTNQAKLRKSSVTKRWSLEIVDFVNKLLQRKPQERLGFRGTSELKNHLWLRDVNWKSIIEKKLEAPFKPERDINIDPRSAIDWSNDIDYSINLEKAQKMFSGYFYDWRETQNKPETGTIDSK